MIKIDYLEDGIFADRIAFIDIEDADEALSEWFGESGVESREDIVDVLNNLDAGQLWVLDIYPQSMDWDFI